MSASYKTGLNQQEHFSESIKLLDWYNSEFTKITLPLLKSFSDDKNNSAEEREKVDGILIKVKRINYMLTSACDKNVWQFYPLETWNSVHLGLHNQIKDFQRDCGKVISTIINKEDQDVYCPTM